MAGPQPFSKHFFLHSSYIYYVQTVPHSPDVALSMEHDCRDTVDGNYTDSMEKGWSVIGMTAEFGDDCVAYRNDVKARAQIESNSNLGSICKCIPTHLLYDLVM